MSSSIMRPRGTAGLQMFVLAAAAVIAVGCGSSEKACAGSGAAQRCAATSALLTFEAAPSPQAPAIDSTVMQQAASIVRGRLEAVMRGAQVSTRGHELFVRVEVQPGAGGTRAFPAVVAEAASLASAPARLVLYDWEANALSTSGKTVASLLSARDRSALAISQPAGSAPGSPGAGSMTLYQAVKLAGKQPEQVSGNIARRGSEYFAFGAPGSSACTAAARYGITQIVGQPCYLAGPALSLADLRSAMPSDLSTSSKRVQTLTVDRGWVVLQAMSPSPTIQTPPWSDPSAQYYVLRDRVALFGSEITNPQPSTIGPGLPDVSFGLTGAGESAYQFVTAQVAHRGELVSRSGQPLNQHFAFALDTQLLTVPSVDFKAFPNGIPGQTGADISGGFTRASARELAEELRLGPLPVQLKLLTVVGRNAHSS